jgi:hypothetical protein
MKLLNLFLMYEVAAFVVNKQAGAQKLPFDFISQLLPSGPPAAATARPGSLTVKSPVGNLTLTSPLITAGGAITS